MYDIWTLGGDSKKGGRGKDSKGSKKGAEPPDESPQPEVTEARSPLLDAKKIGDQWYLPGNTNLVYLTLACEGHMHAHTHPYPHPHPHPHPHTHTHTHTHTDNNIGEAGIQHLLTTLRYQQTLLTPSQPDNHQGLLKLTLHHNSSILPTTLAELTQIMEQRDPLHIEEPTAAVEETAVNDHST